MIVIGEVFTYGTEGKKVEELKSFLKQNVEFRYVEDMESFLRIKKEIRKKVMELNAKYKHTVLIQFHGDVDTKYNTGRLALHRLDGVHPVLSMPVLYVTEYKEGGEV